MAKKTLRAVSVSLFSLFLFLSLNNPVHAAASPQVQTNSATNIQNNSATLNGDLFDLGGYGSSNVWFQWGTDTNYGNTTNSVTQNYTGAFSQQISSLSFNQTYHYRAVAQNAYGTTYGQDMTFVSGQNSGNQQITVNAGPNLYLTSGQTGTLQGSAYSSNGSFVNYSWSCTGGTLSNYSVAQPTYTAPYTSQYATYTCTLNASNSSNQSNSSSTTIYINSSGSNSGTFSVQTSGAIASYPNQAILSGNITGVTSSAYVWFQWGSDTNYGSQSNQQLMGNSGSFNQLIGNLIGGQTYHYRAAAQDNYGNTIYGQDMTFVSTGPGPVAPVYIPPTYTNPTPYVPVYVTPNPTNPLSGATKVSTGLTNNFFTDSFFLPLLLLIIAIWAWNSEILRDLIKQFKSKPIKP